MPSKRRKAKSPGNTPDRPMQHGGALLTGNPGNRGGGRKRDEWRMILQSIVSADSVLDALNTVLQNPNHPAYVGALKYATEHGYGKATESIEISGKDGGPIEQVWRFGTRKVAF